MKRVIEDLFQFGSSRPMVSEPTQQVASVPCIESNGTLLMPTAASMYMYLLLDRSFYGVLNNNFYEE